MHVSVQGFRNFLHMLHICVMGCCIVISSCQEVGQPQPQVDHYKIQPPKSAAGAAV